MDDEHVKRNTVDPTSSEGGPFSAGFDLNLLRVLLALEKTRHVTRAAQLLDMSQSGFSGALARLRRHCDDPLFVRTPDGMVPTPRARSMVARAAELMATVQNDMLKAPVFDPSTANTEFNLGLADVGEVVILPRLMAHLAIIAPRSTLTSHPLPDGEMQAAMAAGEVDLAIGYMPEIQGQDFFQQRLYKHTFACMVRSGHPLDRGSLTRDAYARLGHVLVTSPSRTSALLQRALQEQQLERRVVMRTRHHLSLPSIIAATDLIATVPLAAGERLSERASVKLVPLPFLPQVFDVCQYWHRRYHFDARHHWLREQVAHLFNDDVDPWRGLEEELYGRSIRL